MCVRSYAGQGRGASVMSQDIGDTLRGLGGDTSAPKLPGGWLSMNPSILVSASRSPNGLMTRPAERSRRSVLSLRLRESRSTSYANVSGLMDRRRRWHASSVRPRRARREPMKKPRSRCPDTSHGGAQGSSHRASVAVQVLRPPGSNPEAATAPLADAGQKQVSGVERWFHQPPESAY